MIFQLPASTGVRRQRIGLGSATHIAALILQRPCARPVAANAPDEFIGVSPVTCRENDVDRHGRIVAICTVRGEDIEL